MPELTTIDVALMTAVVLFLTIVVAFLSSAYPRELRLLPWIALVEYLGCAAFEYYYAADASRYQRTGVVLMDFLDADFGWASQELLLAVFQQPSAFDRVIDSAGMNTGSMHAIAGFLMYATRGSTYAAQALIAGMSLMGSFAIYGAFRDACPEVSRPRLYVATVLFPSIAFWTSALHKESFCLMGSGLVFAAWRAVRNGHFRAIVYGAAGLVLIALFRAPALPPIILGLTVFFVLDRMQRARGVDARFGWIAYTALGLLATVAGVVVVGRLSPNLAVDHLSDSVAEQQAAWARVEGGSQLNADAAVDMTAGAQILHAPVALFNAMFRPQLFDVRNPLMLISALEMTTLTVLLVRAIVLHGAMGVLRRIRSSPFLAMCAVAALVGCTFVGLTTRNLGSLARYRVPFLPFYGALLTVLSQRAPKTAPAVAAAPVPSRRPLHS